MTSDRDWDAEMKKIDRQIASLPAEAPAAPKPAQRAAAAPAADRSAGAPATKPTSTIGVFARLTLALVLGVAIAYWPYSARCGIGLAGYLAAVGTLITAGVWSSIWTWRHRAAKGHVLSLLILLWGLVLASADILPRVGWAKSSIDHPARWTCG